MTTNIATLNPFQAVAKTNTAYMTEIGSSREIQEVQAAMVIAKKFPRDQFAAMDRIIQACTRQSLADGALYSYNKGGQEITGPSIRLAETLAQAWGNIQFGIREVEQRDGESTVEAFAWDLETNTRQTKVFQVPHLRHTKSGSKRLTDPRDIYELVANSGARRLRACILGVIPGDVTEAAVVQCEATLAAKADTSPEAVKKLIAAFADFGVTAEMLAKRIGNRLEAIRPAQMLQMKKIYASLRDEMSGISDWFEVNEQPTVANGVNAKLAAIAAAKPAPAPAPKPEPAPIVTAAPVDPEPDSTEWPQDEDGVLVDARGCPWIEAVHSEKKTCTKDNNWRKRRGIDPAVVAKAEHDAIEARLPQLDLEPEPETPVVTVTLEQVLAGIARSNNEDEIDLWLDHSRILELSISEDERLTRAVNARMNELERLD
ncbi:hypothetical protein [Chromatium okenii]|uniref:hypothetical protein n=1 Tax=Chromatium okenii TaxID=61644 RepID=UPI0026F1031B|nr:hypothetical protein [Chromatium okenii]MBV5310798.1 hypothetical protein [Chromatium okenii]